ncbi:MAG: hypothetical protein AAF989_11510 [Planctomycetota bacterium]
MRRTPVSIARRVSRPSTSVVVIDPSPLSLLATAGVLDQQGWQCVCGRSAQMALESLSMGPQDLFVWDVGDDAVCALEGIQQVRDVKGYESVPAVFLADAKWAGLEKKVESMPATRCLFKPIDPPALIAVTEQLLWMPGLVDAHRNRGSRPTRPGWVGL